MDHSSQRFARLQRLKELAQGVRQLAIIRLDDLEGRRIASCATQSRPLSLTKQNVNCERVVSMTRPAALPCILIPPSCNDDQTRVAAMRLLEENLWVEEFIARLNGFTDHFPR
jgi:hypothetical protein